MPLFYLYVFALVCDILKTSLYYWQNDAVKSEFSQNMPTFIFSINSSEGDSYTA